MVCKTDTDQPERLAPEKFFSVDVVTCAAPRLLENMSRDERETPKELTRLYVQRVRHILHIMAAEKAEVLVLGAFGCGVFHNNPALVSAAFRQVLKMYAPLFEAIEFAVYCGNEENENYSAFRQ